MTYKKWDGEISDPLLPCPFCGSEKLDVKHIGNDLSRKIRMMVTCRGCNIKMTHAALSHSFEWLEGVIDKQWNQRV